jgi:hypothetical protein
MTVTKRLPLEMLHVIAEGATEVQGAANGFGRLVSCTIRVEPENEGEHAILLHFTGKDWSVEFVPPQPFPDEC